MLVLLIITLLTLLTFLTFSILWVVLLLSSRHNTMYVIFCVGFDGNVGVTYHTPDFEQAVTSIKKLAEFNKDTLPADSDFGGETAFTVGDNTYYMVISEEP